jgi:hypothetical protein
VYRRYVEETQGIAAASNIKNINSSWERWAYAKDGYDKKRPGAKTWLERVQAYDDYVAREVRLAEVEAYKANATKRVEGFEQLLLMARVIMSKIDLKKLTEREAKKMLSIAIRGLEVASKGSVSELTFLDRLEAISDGKLSYLHLEQMEATLPGSNVIQLVWSDPVMGDSDEPIPDDYGQDDYED